MKPPLRRGEPYNSKRWKWRRFKRFSAHQLDKFPRLKILISQTIRHIELLRYKWRANRIAKQYKREFDPHQTHWIEPQRIQYSSLREFSIHKYEGAVIGGDWDLLER